MDLKILVVYLIITVPFIEALSYLITNSQLFQPWRDILTTLGKKLNLIDRTGTNYLEYMGYCHLCTSHQIALFAACFQPYIRTFPTPLWFMNILITGLILGRCSYVLFNLYELLSAYITRLNTEN